MSLSSMLGVDRFPTLDLHGYDRETARVAIEDFIKENQKLRQEFFVIIHGVGSGILKHTTFETLKRNRSVVEFGVHYFNSGCTIVRIQI